MSESERREFLLSQPRTAIVATVREDGRPHAAPVWFDLDGDDLVFTTGQGSVKGRALRGNPRVAICIDDDRPPFAFVIIEGRASLITDEGEVRKWAGSIGGRYMGGDRAEEMADLNGGPDQMVVRVTASRIVSERAVAG